MAAIYNNTNTTTLTAGELTTPIVALAFSYAMATFANCTAGAKIKLSCNSKSIDVVINSNGTANVSLLPFIKDDMAARLERPIGNISTNFMRGQLSIAVSNEDSDTTDVTVAVFYIYGDCAPRAVYATEQWCDLNSDSDNYSPFYLDLATNYTNGVPNTLAAFQNCWANGSTITPFYNGMVYTCIRFYGDKIVQDNITFNVNTDCRTMPYIRRVRWIDSNGNLHCRKLVFAEEAEGGTVGDSYQRPHDVKAIANGSGNYDRGSDTWANITATRQVTLGDESIPIERYDDLKELATSPIVEMYEQGAWTRCNVTGFTVERDPRKASFNLTVTLQAPTYTVQEF